MRKNKRTEVLLMSCQHYKNEIVELTRKNEILSKEIQEHLHQCSDCSKYLESQLQLNSALQDFKRKDKTLIPAQPSSRLLNAVRQKERRRASEFFWMKAAAIFIISVLCGSYW